ncbi:flavodoxin, short chain [Methanococcoides vulcani]|uniref:Flavodoxin, short chain n=1 Tax=Methanococcoides vulcani TaxID=1353158 RepID=A0A1H9Y0C6_9EURY|nr:flavodoxin [Methanococcoides vulcani]SES62202.1 flavodoxin, short chain [Methanococcoides vulcani]
MTKNIIVYGSTTGNTQILAEEIEDTLKRSNGDFELMKLTDLQPSDLTAYDLILWGCSTWGKRELQDDFISFKDGMKDIDLSGKKVACFGFEDSDYSLFCEAVNMLEEWLKHCGPQVIIEGVKIDGDVDAQLVKAEEWSENVVQAAS